MKTVVYQSYRTLNVAPWIQQCLETVKAWTAQQGFDYHFIDDALFDYVPSWYREKVRHNILLMSDLARLEVAKELLLNGYDRAIWVDADIVVFDPENLTIDITKDYAFCRELWLAPDDNGQLRVWRRVHNAVSVYVKGNHFLTFYSQACLRMVRNKAQVGSLDAGTRFLSTLYESTPYQLINNVGLFSPTILQSIDTQNREILQCYRSAFGFPVYAANLCGSFCGKPWFGQVIDNALYSRVINRLLQTRGQVINH